MYHRERTYIERTVISFIVSVPVLSELIALVAPRVSTSVRFFTTALCSVSCLAPKASIVCTKVGKPVGMAEIAIATPNMSTDSMDCPRATPRTTMSTTAAQAITPRTLVSESSSRCSGDFLGATTDNIVAIWPI